MVILDSHIEGAQMYGPRQRADIYRAIIEYTSYGTEPGWLKGEALGFFVAIRPTLDELVECGQENKDAAPIERDGVRGGVQ